MHNDITYILDRGALFIIRPNVYFNFYQKFKKLKILNYDFFCFLLPHFSFYQKFKKIENFK